MATALMEDSTRDLVVSVVSEHAESLLRVARRYTACAADAEDAYQRALEIFVKNAGRLEPEAAHRWLHVVVRNEALAVRRARVERSSGVEEEAALDALDDGRHVASVEERSERFEEMTRAAEALQRLKPQEVTALWLKAQGLSYDEIAERAGVDVHEGQPLHHRGPARVPRALRGDRVGRRVRALGAGRSRRWPTARRRRSSSSTPGRTCATAPPAGRSLGGDAAAAGPPPRRSSAGARSRPRRGRRRGRAAGRLARARRELRRPRPRGATVVKAQAAVEARASGKVAAVAASTAAIAGGGVAVERQLADDPARAAARPPARVVEASAAAPPRPPRRPPSRPARSGPASSPVATATGVSGAPRRRGGGRGAGRAGSRRSGLRPRRRRRRLAGARSAFASPTGAGGAPEHARLRAPAPPRRGAARRAPSSGCCLAYPP